MPFILNNIQVDVSAKVTNSEFVTLKFYIDTILLFNGTDNWTMKILLKNCNRLVSKCSNKNPEDSINSFLIRTIISYSGDALMLVGSFAEVRDWKELKAFVTFLKA